MLVKICLIDDCVCAANMPFEICQMLDNEAIRAIQANKYPVQNQEQSREKRFMMYTHISDRSS